MFFSILIFELKYRFSRPATYVYFALLLIVALILIASGSTPASEKVFHNSPVIIANLQLLLSLFSILIASAVMGVPVYRDLEHRTASFLFSYPISDGAYLMGRFWGSFITLIFISLGGMMGIYLGSIIGPATAWTDAARFGPNELINYLQPWLTMVLPNLWLAGTLFFSLIIFTRNIKSIYSGGIVLFIAYLLANFLAKDIENRNLVQLLDPFGLNTFDYQTRYLTPFEQNNYLLDISGNFLWNRILWSSLGVVLLVGAYFRFNFNYFFQERQSKSKQNATDTPPVSDEKRTVWADFSINYQWNSLLTLSKLEIKNVTKDIYFRSILLGGLIFLVLDFWIGETIFSVPNMPVTSILMEYKTYDYNLFVFIILVFFTGEALHRDKATGYSVISDTFPVKDWVIIASKFAGMFVICVILATLPILVGLLVQVGKGYFQFDLPVYLVDSYLISLPDYLQMMMLVFAVHLVVNQKFAGHAVSIGIWLVMVVMRSFADFNFNLFFYSYKPNYMWSEMNGLGHFGEPLFWFNLYWTAFGLFLVLFFSIFYSRGTESSLKSRLLLAKGRLLAPSTLASYGLLVVALGSGAFIYKNVVYDNNYLTIKENDERTAEYEKQLKQYEFIPQPKFVRISLKADLYPEERDAYFTTDIQLVNKTDSPIDSIHFQQTALTDFQVLYSGDTLNYRFPLTFSKPKFQLFGQKKQKEWYKIYALPQPMMPGDTLDLQIHSNLVSKGFPNGGFGREIVHNGTFVSTSIPSIGYNSRGELTSDEKRKKYGLPEREEDLPPHDDAYGTQTLLFASDADFIQFEAVISTVPSQIAVAPGYLQREWIEGDRRYFHYIQDTPIQAFFTVVSAAYEVEKEKVTLESGEEIDIELFYHPDHSRNLDRFMAAYVDGLHYFSATYTPFQFRQMRLLEFPRYAGFAQSFPNTVPFSESFGWIANLSDPNSFDYVYFVTAHELAHQWWGHQITPNYTRGSNLISEALAEYSALILTERTYGKDNMKRFLKDELDKYLSGRSNEGKKENVFINCNRPYQWYYKGSLILYGLRDYIGDEAMNEGLRNFAEEFSLKESPPFPGSADLYRHLAARTPDSMAYYLEDTWKKITLYENKAEAATSTKNEDGTYAVTIKVKSQKIYADSTGRENPAIYEGDYMDIGIFAKEDKDENGRTRTNPLYLEKHKIKPGETTITLTVESEPVKAGIDPYNKLIDRIPDDNLIAIESK